MINNLHHFEILTNSSANLLNYFINGFKFKLVLSKQTGKYCQYLINSNSINFLITSLEENGNKNHSYPNDEKKANPLVYSTPLDLIESNHRSIFNTIYNRKNTVFNAAFQVRDLDRILWNCDRHNVPVIRKKHVLLDEESRENGFVEYAVIGSCIEGVVHSLFNLNDYKGSFLPGYEIKKESNIPEREENNSLATHFDHLTYATPKNTSNSLIEWYKNIFGMKHFRINREENDGLIVQTGDSGMNLKAIRYWLCAETGVEFGKESTSSSSSSNSLYANDFKFVISEPLEEAESETRSKNKNQISIFLDEHDGAGIQHIGLHTPDIVRSVQESKMNCDQVKFYATPDIYYETPDKVEEIDKCGLDVELLKKNHILLDAEFNENNRINETTGKPEPSPASHQSPSSSINTFLLQVFTQPIFEKNTVFLELIQRVGDAQGFGAANIKALWNAVQYQINNKIRN